MALVLPRDAAARHNQSYGARLCQVRQDLRGVRTLSSAVRMIAKHSPILRLEEDAIA